MSNHTQFQIHTYLQHQRMKMNIKFGLIVFFALNALASNFAQIASEKPKKWFFPK